MMSCLLWFLDQYRSRLLSALTQLEVLDGVNLQGESVSSFDVLADIPGNIAFQEQFNIDMPNIRMIYTCI